MHSPRGEDPPQAGTARLTVTRHELAPGEWALLAVPGSLPDPPVLHEALLGLAVRPWPRPGIPVEVRPAVIPPQLGVAVLHCRAGQAIAYCSDGDIADPAPAALTRQAACVTPRLGPRAASSVLPAARFIPIECDELPDLLHPAVSYVHGMQVTTFVCANLLSRRLADALTLLGTALLQDPLLTPAAAGHMVTATA
jgi:hypothetical protein